MTTGTMPSNQDLVAEFHRKFDVTSDFSSDSNATWLRHKLIKEEVTELAEAIAADDKVAAADALGDISYLVYGAADLWDIDLDRVFREVHRSNMTKTGGGKRADGKILKGPDYSSPDLSFVMEGQ